MASTAEDIAAAYGLPLQFAERLVQVSRAAEIKDPAFLANIINFESGFDPAKLNRATKAVGLLQFLPSTAEALGTSTDALLRMSSIEQMEYVQRYFLQPHLYRHRPWKTQLDVCMAVFYPKAIKKGKSYVFPDEVRRANPGINKAGDYLDKVMSKAKLLAPDVNARDAVLDAVRENPMLGLLAAGFVVVVASALFWMQRRYAR